MTIEINDELYKRMKRFAHMEGLTTPVLIESLLRAYMADEEALDKKLAGRKYEAMHETPAPAYW